MFDKQPFRYYCFATIGFTIGEVMVIATDNDISQYQVLLGFFFIMSGIVTGWSLVLLNYTNSKGEAQ